MADPDTPSPTAPSLVTRSIRIFLQSTVTLAVVAVAVFVLVIGVGMLGDRAAAVPDPEGADPVPVAVSPARFETGYSVPRRFIGQVEAQAAVSLSFELDGQLGALLVEEGDRVVQGQKVAALDTDLLQAEAARLRASRAAASAQLTFAETRLARALALQKQGFTSQETLDQALAARDELTNRIAETDAALDTVAINLEKSVLYAPFDGQVAAQTVDRAETIRAGQEIAMILQTRSPQVRIGLPLDIDASALQSVHIDLDGRQMPARLSRLRPDIDPVTRTRTAIFDLDPAAQVLFGQTVALVIETRVDTEGLWVPLDALQSGKGSVWTVMVVDDNRLRRAAVEILHMEADRAYVRGSLAEGTQIVTGGAHRVVAGQQVTVIGSEG